jgi:hypothetical protein
MDDKDFRKHLRDLAHGHHHPEEHDWSSGPGLRPAAQPHAKHKTAAKRTKRKKSKAA